MGIFKILLFLALKHFKIFNQIARILRIPQSKELLRLLFAEPQKVGELLGNLSGSQVDSINVVLDKVKKTTTITSPSTKRVNDVLGDLKNETAKRKVVSQDLIVAARKQREDRILSSSWIVWGRWEPDPTGTVGDLTIETKKGSQYTYPSVPYITWTAMKKARGKNGSGAGSVFWALYLRARKVSTYHFKVSRVFEMAGVRVPQTNPIEFLKTRG